MDDPTTRDLVEMDRRGFLESLGAIGLAGSTLEGLTREKLEALTDDPAENVPRLGWWSVDEQGTPPHEREPVYYTISRDKWTRVESAHDAREQVESALAGTSLAGSVCVRTRTNNGNSEKEVVAKYVETHHPDGSIRTPDISFSEFESLVPASVDGVAGRGTDVEQTVENIPVQTEQVVVDLQIHYDYEYRAVSAGCVLRPNTDDPDNTYYTNGVKAYSNQYGEDVLVSAGHALDSSSWEEVYQNGSIPSDRIGDADDTQVIATNDFDAGVIRLDSGIDATALFAHDDGTNNSPAIEGVVSDQRIKDLEGDSTDGFTKQGATTGRETGWVYEVYDRKFLLDGVDSQGGDSGGPHYEVRDSPKAYAAGIHKGHISGNAVATKCVDIESEFSLQIPS